MGCLRPNLHFPCAKALHAAAREIQATIGLEIYTGKATTVLYNNIIVDQKSNTSSRLLAVYFVDYYCTTHRYTSIHKRESSIYEIL